MALARWRSVEREAPGGLNFRRLKQVAQMVSTPADRVRRNPRSAAAPSPVVLMNPYLALVPTPDHVGYLDGHTLPQFEGWMRAGGLQGYEIALSRYPADRPWHALIFLRYRDDVALGRREATAAAVRQDLARDPAWAAIRDNKKASRVERAAVVADQLAAGGEGT